MLFNFYLPAFFCYFHRTTAGIIQCFAKNDVAEVSESKLLQVKPKPISGGMIGTQPLGTIPHFSKNNRERNSKLGKGRKKHKHSKFFLYF